MILIIAGVFLLVGYRWGDWRNWKSYYPTIMFLIMGDLIYLYVASAKPLWHYTAKQFPGMITTLIVALIIYPCTVLIFVPSYLKSDFRWKIGNLAIWVGVYFVLEFFALKHDYMKHFNGWNLGYSFFFDCIVFPLIILHYKRSLLAWLLAGIFGVCITIWFKLPAPY